ncbi:hypothetical protein [Nostoc sp.]
MNFLTHVLHLAGSGAQDETGHAAYLYEAQLWLCCSGTILQS